MLRSSSGAISHQGGPLAELIVGSGHPEVSSAADVSLTLRPGTSGSATGCVGTRAQQQLGGINPDKPGLAPAAILASGGTSESPCRGRSGLAEFRHHGCFDISRFSGKVQYFLCVSHSAEGAKIGLSPLQHRKITAGDSFTATLRRRCDHAS